ncbi:hypothetical protein D3C72_1805310 [compost metagenome]
MPTEDTTTSRACPGRTKAGSCAVTITAAMLRSCMLVPGGTVMPNCDSMLVRLWPVNGACMVWSPEPSRPTTRP